MDCSGRGCHGAFLKEHLQMETSWPALYMHHPYFAGGCFREEMVLVMRVRSRLNTLRSKLTAQPAQPVRSAPAAAAKLPALSLPEFSGKYRDWTEFRERITALVLNKSTLSDVEKLQYLRGCLKGAAA